MGIVRRSAELNTGALIPLIGLGTASLEKNQETIIAAVTAALQVFTLFISSSTSGSWKRGYTLFNLEKYLYIVGKGFYFNFSKKFTFYNFRVMNSRLSDSRNDVLGAVHLKYNAHLMLVFFQRSVWYPKLILPTIFLCMFLIGIWHYRFCPRHPPHMDTWISHPDAVHPDELDEEFDTFPTSKSSDVVRMRYDWLRSIAGRLQTVVGDMATQGERFQALLSWRDPRATAIFFIFCLLAAIFLYVTPFQEIAVLFGIYVLRHPRFQHKLPSFPLNFFRRLPARSDSML